MSQIDFLLLVFGVPFLMFVIFSWIFRDEKLYDDPDAPRPS